MELLNIFGLEEWIFWLILTVFFAAVELSTVNLVSLWFAIGSLSALGVSLSGLGMGYQIAAFLIFSIITLTAFVLFRKKLKITNNTIEKTNADRNIGKTGVVIEAIDPVNSTGQVKFDGQIWSARSLDDVAIPVGTIVIAVEIKGVKLVVRPS